MALSLEGRLADLPRDPVRLMEAFLVSYIALGEAREYAVPAIGPWLTVELIAGFCQFTLAGLQLRFIPRRSSRPAMGR